MIIKFYKYDNRWYAYLPEYIALGGTEEECEMVCGADVMLDIIAQGEDNVVLNMDTEDDTLPNVLKLVEICKNDSFDLNFEGGAFYMLNKYQNLDFNLPIWLCSVTNFVFGTYPENIYFRKLG